MNCWFDHAVSVLSRAAERCGWPVSDAFNLMCDGDIAKFCFTDIPWSDAQSFGKELAEHSVLRLPFPRCYFQYGFEENETALFVSEFDTSDGLIWYMWRAMRFAVGESGFGVMTFANLTTLGEGHGPFMRNLPVFRAFSHIEERNVSNMDEALACVAFLGFRGVETTIVSPRMSVVKRRERENRPPLPTYHVVKVRGVREKSHASMGSHASPCPHWRRGHVRILPSGKATVVRPHPVGGSVVALPTYEVM